jgi:hypothetical protein
MKWLQMAMALFQLMPEIFKLIGEAETAIGAGNGALKKSLVMAPLAVAGAPADVTTKIGNLIDTVVSAKNTAAVLPQASPIAKA